MEVYPGDKIVIHKAVLWLGLAAIFYLPLLIIPLRTVENQRARAHWFPEVGYDSYEGAWIKIQIPFGKDQYYYGYYIVNYFTKLGLGLGYVGFYASKKGRRSVSVNVYTINNQAGGGRQTNLAAARAGELLTAPARQLSGQLSVQLWAAGQHSTQRIDQRGHRPPDRHKPRRTTASATARSAGNPAATASRSRDTRQFNQNLNQTTTYNISDSNASFGGLPRSAISPSSTT